MGLTMLTSSIFLRPRTSLSVAESSELSTLTAQPNPRGPRGILASSPCESHESPGSHQSASILSTDIIACCSVSRSRIRCGSSDSALGGSELMVTGSEMIGSSGGSHVGDDHGRSSSPRRKAEGSGGRGLFVRGVTGALEIRREDCGIAKRRGTGRLL